MKTRKRFKRLPKALLCATLACAMCMSAGTAVLASASAIDDGKYYNDYSSFEEAEAAADDLNTELSREGNVLLKNDGTLPLTGREYVSVFGVSSDSLISVREDATNASGTIADSLRQAGFRVNPTLEGYYASIGTTVGSETYEFDRSVSDSFGLYGDAAVVVFARPGGEGNDNETVTDEVEDNVYGKEKYTWEHKALARGSYDANGEFVYDEDSETEYKHYQQFTDSEELLLSYVKEHFDKVIVVLNTANAFEMYNLEHDPGINAILLMQRPGETGHLAVGEILCGMTNPSGRLVDEWYSDFTADPTWYNFGWLNQVGTVYNAYQEYNSTTKQWEATGPIGGGSSPSSTGFYGIDYEEDIYLGYKYYETYYYELAQKNGTYGENANLAAAQAWYEGPQGVVYPFGYGLSYTEFSLNIEGVYTDAGLTKALGASVDKGIFESYVGHEAEVETLYIPVEVTNTGDVAGKEVVEIYVTAPYTTGEVEKSFVVLAGYAKSDELAPGASQTVVVSINVQDFSSFDYDDANENENTGYELDLGEYTIRAMSTSHFDLATDISDETDEYDEFVFELTADDGKAAFLKLDDFSGNEATPVFSDAMPENAGYTDATGGDYVIYTNSIRTANYSADNTSAMTLMSRADFEGTFPEPPTDGDMQLKDDVFANWRYWNHFGWNSQSKDEEHKDFTYTDEGTPWYISETEFNQIAADWTQSDGSDRTNGLCDILLMDMAGISPYTTEGAEDWEEFMNQLTWEELITIVETGGHSTSSIPAIGKIAATESDSPNNLSNTHTWCDETTVASTWNTELAHRQGIIVADMAMYKGVHGWWGPAMDTHRSPFSGRNNEYYSQDGIQGGYIAAAVVSGAESRGLNCYIKHFALNDQESNRDGMNNCSWISEQAMRENNLKVFQMAMQEGGSAAAMCAFARISGVPTAANYAFLVELADDEWGWNGVFLTDGYMGVANCTTGDSMVRVGCMQLNLGGSTTVSGEWDATLRGNKGGVKVDGEESYHQYYYVRKFATDILYEAANCFSNENGFTTFTMEDKALTAGTQGAAMSSSIAIAAATLDGSTASYAVTSGALPEGVTLSSDGTLSGTPATYGDYSFTVTATIDKWITRTADYTLHIDTAFKISGDALDSAKVGSAFRTAIVSDTINTDEGNYTTVVYSLVSGALPAGMTLSEGGVISGTPTEAGTFDFTVQAVASQEQQGGGPGGPGGPGGAPGGPGGGTTVTSTTFYYSASLTVAEGAAAVETGGLRVEGGNLQYQNAQGEWTTIASVADLSGVGTSESTIRVEGGNLQYLNDGEWTTIAAIADIGSSESVRVEGGNLQYLNNGEWTTIAAIADLGATEEAGGCGGTVIGGVSIAAAAVVLAAAAVCMVRSKRKETK